MLLFVAVGNPVAAAVVSPVVLQSRGMHTRFAKGSIVWKSTGLSDATSETFVESFEDENQSSTSPCFPLYTAQWISPKLLR